MEKTMDYRSYFNLRRTDPGIFIPQACLNAHNWVGSDPKKTSIARIKSG